MFDSNAYRREVLRPLLDSGDRQFADPFLVMGLDPSVDDPTALRARIDEVVAFWRKEQSSPRYRSLVSALLDQRERFARQLLDPTERAEISARVTGERAAASREKLAELAAIVEQLARRHGGIPASRVDRLRSVAQRDGVAVDDLDDLIGRHRLIDDARDRLPPPPPAIRRQVRALLEEVGYLREHEGEPRSYRTLYDFLGAAEDAPLDELRGRHQQIASRNRQRRPDRLRTVTDELLAHARTLVIDGDQRSYAAGLLADVGDELRPEVEMALLVDDRLRAEESERLLRLAVSRGVEPATARRVVLDVARELGAAIETGVPVAYVVCVHCRTASPGSTTGEPSERACERCGAALYRRCPTCQRDEPAASARCAGCGTDLRAHDEAAVDLAALRADLAAGHVREAEARADQLVAWASSVPEVMQAARDVRAARELAEADWERLDRAMREGRFDDAESLVGAIEHRANDLEGPGGRTVDAVRGEIRSSLDELRRRVEAALALPGSEREAAIVALAEEAPTSREVLAALRPIPVAAPSRPTAVVRGRNATVSWRRSPAPGAIEYRVFRQAMPPDGGADDGRSLGSTPQTEIEDGGAPPGSLVRYEVQAVRFGIVSGTVSTSPVLIAPEVDDLTAVERDGAVELRWSSPGDEVEIWVERTDLDDPEGTLLRMRGGVHGVVDTQISSGHHYRYRVFVQYRLPDGGNRRTAGCEVAAIGYVRPPAPRLDLHTEGDEVKCLLQGSGGHLSLLRCTSDPHTAPGSAIDIDRLEELGGEPLPLADGVAHDRLDGRFRWFLPVVTAGAEAVLGAAQAHPGVGEVAGLTTTDDNDGIVVRWRWPSGCTEATVVYARDVAPSGVDDPSATTSKITNTAYELRGGWRLDGATPGEWHFLVLGGTRLGSTLVAVPGPSSRSRVVHHRQARPEVSYALRRVGLLRRSLEVEVSGAEGTRPPLVVVVEARHRPDSSPATIATIAPDQRTIRIPPDRCVPGNVLSVQVADADSEPSVVIRHPPRAGRTV